MEWKPEERLDRSREAYWEISREKRRGRAFSPQGSLFPSPGAVRRHLVSRMLGSFGALIWLLACMIFRILFPPHTIPRMGWQDCLFLKAVFLACLIPVAAEAVDCLRLWGNLRTAARSAAGRGRRTKQGRGTAFGSLSGPHGREAIPALVLKGKRAVVYFLNDFRKETFHMELESQRKAAADRLSEAERLFSGTVPEGLGVSRPVLRLRPGFPLRSFSFASLSVDCSRFFPYDIGNGPQFL